MNNGEIDRLQTHLKVCNTNIETFRPHGSLYQSEKVTLKHGPVTEYVTATG